MFTNFTEEQTAGSFSLNLENYGLSAGDYTITQIDSSGHRFFDRFTGYDYSKNICLSARSLLFLQLQSTTAVENFQEALPLKFLLKQNYPNPFNPVTTIAYQLRTEGYVKIIIYDLLGQEVRTLVEKRLPAGEYTVIWDGKNNFGKMIGTGIYFYQLKISSIVIDTKKLLFLK